MGLFKLLGKYGIKALKYLLIGAKNGAITLGKGAISAIKFLQAHPVLFYNLVSAAGGAAINDIVNSYAASKGIKTKEVNQYLGYVNELEQELNGLGDLDKILESASSPKTNHAPWWFNPSTKVSYFDPADEAISNGRLRQATVHTLGHYAPFEPTELMKQSIYKAYLEYYKRLNIGVTTTTVSAAQGSNSTAVAQVVVPPHKMEEVIRDIKQIIEYSWRGVTNLLELQRMESAYEIQTNGSYALPFGLLGYADIYIPSNKAWENSVGKKTPMFPATQYPVDTEAIQEFFGYKAYQTKIPGAYAYAADVTNPEVLRSAHGTRYNYGNISNATWASLVNRAHRDFYISQNAWSLARYLYEGVFVDQPKEDNMEIFVFVSDTTDGREGQSWTRHDGMNLLESVRDSCAEVERIISSDRAYENLLLHLDVSPYSKNKAEFYKWEFRRDLAHTTLLLKDTDESFYTALQNAALMIRFPDKDFKLNSGASIDDAIPFDKALASAREIELSSPNGITSWKEGGVQRGRIYLGERKSISSVDNMYNLLPDLQIEDAGVVASAMKFGGCARIRYYSRMIFDDVPGDSKNKNKWILTYFNMTNSVIWGTNGVLGQLKDGYIDGKFSDLARKEWAFAVSSEMERGSFSVNNGYKIFCDGLDKDYPQVSYILRYSNPGYKVVDVTNLDTVLLYQYSNLYMGVGSNEELIEKLEVLKDWYKTQM